MGQSLVKQYTHIIFSTKHQQPLIIDVVENELYKYIGGICKNMECYPVKVGGYRNHVHILCLLSKKIALMKLLEEVKSHSSKWVKTIDKRMNNFYWQNGYGAFSVNPAEIRVVSEYIERQAEHHKKVTFQDEYRAYLKEFEVEYDERYVWD